MSSQSARRTSSEKNGSVEIICISAWSDCIGFIVGILSGRQFIEFNCFGDDFNDKQIFPYLRHNDIS